MIEAEDIFYLCYMSPSGLAILLWLKISGVGRGKSALFQSSAFIGERVNTIHIIEPDIRRFQR
ncbi:hypothetical protein A0E43_01375 [Pectobacterium cacticida]